MESIRFLHGRQERPTELQEAIRHFTDEQVCIDTIAHMRWPNGRSVQPARARNHYYLKTKSAGSARSAISSSPSNWALSSRIRLFRSDKWLLRALWMLVNCKNGISSLRSRTRSRNHSKVRLVCAPTTALGFSSRSLAKLGGSGNPVEVDETFIGGKAETCTRLVDLRMKVREHNLVKNRCYGNAGAGR